MATETDRPRSRRAVLTAAVTGAAAAAAATVAAASPSLGANGDNVVIGSLNNQGNTVTKLTHTGGGVAFWGFSANGTGVEGESTSGAGVLGISASGYAIVGQSPNGHALQIQSGRIQIKQVSGVATIGKGKKQVSVDAGIPINAETFVLLTPMANIGSRALWFTKLAAKGRFVIHLSSPRTSATKVAWLALERG